jgi:hypothetical protein
VYVPDLNIPDWVSWIARDRDGSWWGYSAEPHQHTSGWYENEVGDCIRLGDGEPGPGWQHSLRRLKN